MPRYVATVPSSLPVEELFARLAPFDSVVQWDPGVTAASAVDDGPVRLGSRYDVTVKAGRPTTLRYEVTELDAPRRIVLVARSKTLQSRDEMTFATTPSGSEVTYDAEVILLGPFRVLHPLFGLAFRRIGDRAAEGLRRFVA